MPKIFQFIQRFLKKKYIILILVVSVLFGMMGEAYNLVIKERQGSMVIEFNYPGSENGLNPDGSSFDISVLKSDEVLNRAKANLKDQGIDTDFLKSRIFITSKISSAMMDKVVSNVQNEKNNVYLPTTFYVYYSQKNKFSKNETALFMQSLANAYREYFNEKYSEKNDVLKFQATDYDFENADYDEIYTVLGNKVDSMIMFMQAHQKENRAFYSEDQVNLGTAVKRLESFRDVNLMKFNSYIVQNCVSKNNQEYVKRVNYFVENKTMEYEKFRDASEITKRILSEYDPSVIAIAFIPSIDSKNNYYMSQAKTGIDDLTKQSYEDGMSASRVLKDVNAYQNLSVKFKEAGPADATTRDKADEMVKLLLSELEEISADVLKTDTEYLQHKTMNYLKIRLPQHTSVINLRLILKFAILGFVLAMAVVVITEMLQEKFGEKFKKLKAAVASIKTVKKHRR